MKEQEEQRPNPKKHDLGVPSQIIPDDDDDDLPTARRIRFEQDPQERQEAENGTE